jgi:hypothetical protein
MLSALNTFIGISALGLTWVMAVVIQRLYFSPLAKFPGPKLAAITLWYEFYFNIIKGGVYIWEIEKMHKKYGLIVP